MRRHNTVGDPASPQQQKVLDFIRAEVQRRGFPPTQQELGQALDLSPGTIRDYLRHLEAKGYIKLHLATVRGIQLLAPAD